jgi:hypothetical protein
MSSRLSWRLVAAAILAVAFVAPAQAVIVPLAFYHLGENDPGAAVGGPVSTTIDSLQTQPGKDLLNTSFAPTDIIYSGDAPDFTTSTRSVNFVTSEAYLDTTATAWYQATGAFRWGMEAFIKPDASTQGRKSVFFTNGGQFNMGYDADGKFYVNQTGPGTTTVKYGEWQHVAFTTTGSFWQIYVDGVPQFATLPNFSYGAPSGLATLGANNNFDPNEGYVGLIDEHRVFSWSGAFNPNELLWYSGRGDGDVNEDGAVNTADYDIWRANVGADISAITPLQGRARGDLNGDRQINLLDFGLIKANKSPGVVFVPEPGAATLLLVGAAAIATLRRKRTTTSRVSRGKPAIAALALGVALLSAANVSAQATATWNGGNGNWNDANWAGGSGPGGRPGDGDNVVLPPTTGTLVVNSAVAPVFNAISQQGGVLDIQTAGALNFLGLYEHSDGTAPGSELKVAGALTVGGGLNAARDVAGTVSFLNGADVSVTGDLDSWWDGVATVNLNSNTNVDVSATMYVGPGAIYNASITAATFNPIEVATQLSIQGGTLNVSFSGVPTTLTSKWTLFDAAARAGTFTNVTGSGLSPGTRVQVNYVPGGTLGQIVEVGVASTLNLRIDQSSGQLTIQNPAAGAAAQDIDGYIISSTTGSLSPGGFTGVGQAGWLPGLPASQTAANLSETNFNGSLNVTQGASYPLGTAFTPGGAGQPSIAFQYRLVTGEILNGTVEFVGTPGFPADFDDNGRVDGADLTVWRNAHGSTAAGDADGDGDTDGNDFLVWQRSVGSGIPPISGAATAVPEPSSLLAALCGLAAIAAAGRRVR